VDRFDRTHRVALDAGNLHQPADGVAGHAEVVLHADLRACSTCALVPPIAAASPPAAMEQATPTSPLATDLRSGDRRVLLVEDADGRRGEEVAQDARLVRAGDVVAVIVRDAGMTPAAPLVGAVTTRLPAAFSSFTAMA